MKARMKQEIEFDEINSMSVWMPEWNVDLIEVNLHHNKIIQYAQQPFIYYSWANGMKWANDKIINELR